jgi:hypothetical protein
MKAESANVTQTDPKVTQNEDELINSLLEYINRNQEPSQLDRSSSSFLQLSSSTGSGTIPSSNSLSSNSSKDLNSSLPAPTPTKSTLSSSSSPSQLPNSGSGSWTAALPTNVKRVKIFIAEEPEPLTLEFTKEQTSQNLMFVFEQIANKKKWGENVSVFDSYGFQVTNLLFILQLFFLLVS